MPKIEKIEGIEKFNTGKVNNMEQIFNYCTELEELDLSHFDTSNVELMGGIFNGCTKLKIIKGIEKFNTSQVIDMFTMFQSCEELEELDLSNFDVSTVASMMNIFYGCNKLKTLNILNFNMNPYCKITNMFTNINKNICKLIVKNPIIEEIFKYS